MVFVSRETSEQTTIRLQSILRAAELKVFDQPYAYVEQAVPLSDVVIDPQALAWIRDEDSFSQLVPASGSQSVEIFTLVCFHFPANLDNSGFVGWLASRFKEQLGSGVFVVCGQNSARGGVYDYFGIPEALRADAIKLLTDWRS